MEKKMLNLSGNKSAVNPHTNSLLTRALYPHRRPFLPAAGDFFVPGSFDGHIHNMRRDKYNVRSSCGTLNRSRPKHRKQ